MRVKVHDFEGTKQAVSQYGAVLSDWDDTVWKLALQKE
jgi:hypothetical protein